MEDQSLAGLGRLFDFAETGRFAGGVSEITAKRWTKRRVNPLPTVRIGHNLVRIAETHLVAWLESQVKPKVA
jgi:hypothetical protein